MPLTAAMVSGSRLAPGSSRLSSGRNRAASFFSRPHCFSSSINPDHRHSTPAREIHSSTAALAPSRAAAETSAIFPPVIPHTTDAATITTQTTAIAIALHLIGLYAQNQRMISTRLAEFVKFRLTL